MSEKHFILMPPPCTNASLHMGHLSAVYIPADIYSRYLRQLKKAVITIAGADQQNTYTLKKAITEGKLLSKTQEHYASLIQQSLDNANIIYESFIKTTSNAHKVTVNEIINELINKNLAKIRKVNQFYCLSCADFAVDSYVVGKCNFCGETGSDAGICESCCSPIFNYALHNAKHVSCNSSLTLKPLDVICFDINQIKNSLITFANQFDDSPDLIERTIRFINSNRSDTITLSNRFEHGLKLEGFNLDGSFMNIWFEAVWIFFTGLKQIIGANNLNDTIQFLNDNNTYIHPFMGQDSEFIYTNALNMVLLGLGIKAYQNLPSIQRFVKLDNQKFSSSRNHLITLDQINKNYTMDVIRFYSMSILKPYIEDNNHFSVNELDKFSTRINMLLKNLSTKMGNEKIASTIHNDLQHHDITILKQYDIAMHHYNFQGLTQIILDVSEQIIKGDCAYHPVLLVWILNPIMPNCSKKLLKIFDKNFQQIQEKIIPYL